MLIVQKRTIDYKLVSIIDIIYFYTEYQITTIVRDGIKKSGLIR